MKERELKNLLKDFLNSTEVVEENKKLLKLIQTRRKTFRGSDQRSEIEMQIIESVKQEKDLSMLIIAQRNTSRGSNQRSEIDEKFSESVKQEKHLGKLMQAWWNTFQGSHPKAEIDAQITEVIKEVTVENIPTWFERQLKVPSFPPWILEKLQQRARELLSQMED